MTCAANALMTHIACNWKAISTLCTSECIKMFGSSMRNPTTALLRCIYDAQIQLLYILNDPNEAEQRASRYLRFGPVEHYKYLNFLDSCKSPMAKRITALPGKQEARSQIEAQYQEARNSMTEEERGWKHWYKGSLYDLARIVGREEEYTWCVRFSNGAVHGSPFATIKGSLSPGGVEAAFASVTVVTQTARIIGRALGLNFSDNSRRWIETTQENFLSR